MRTVAIIWWLREVFARFGCPDELVMDNSPQFISHEFQTFLAEMGIHGLPVAVFNPCENGLMEHWNCTLKGGIQAFCSLDSP